MFRPRLQGGIDVLWKNPPGVNIIAKNIVGQKTLASQKLLCAAHGILKMKIFQAMQRIVMNKGAHGPVLCDDLTRKTDERSQLDPLGFAVVRLCHLFHNVISNKV